MDSISYDSLAYIYDKIMSHVPYDKWVNDLEVLFDKHNIKPSKILDCGCGTGEMTLRLAKKGYAMTGVDLSEHMLMIARQKSSDAQMMIKYLQVDISSMDISFKQDLIISYFDVINYLNDDDLVKFFDSAYFALKDGGYLIFDVSTQYKMQYELGSQTFIDNAMDISYIWENYYDADDKSLEFEISFFVSANNNDDNIYERYDEFHKLWVHDLDKIKNKSNGKFEILEALDADDLKKIRMDSLRNIFVMKKI